MRLDSHQHYWKIDRGDYGWITPEVPALYRDFGPEHLAPHLAKHRLYGSIVVQAAPTPEETDYLLALASTSDSVLGVVGYLDLTDGAHEAHYERFARHPKFVGFRVMIQEMADARRVLEPSFVEALRRYARLDVPIDLLLTSGQLEPVIELLDRVPGLRGVIDHIAKPRIGDGIIDPWCEQLSRIASHGNIYCKLSGMLTEADHANWRPEQFVGYIRHAIDAFGPYRVMFGSDWPVCLLAGSYDQVMDVLESALPPSWGEAERERLYGLNAKEFYKL